MIKNYVFSPFRNFLRTTLIVTIAFCFTACRKNLTPLASPKANQKLESDMVLGKKLENPFSLKNLRKANTHLAKEMGIRTSKGKLMNTAQNTGLSSTGDFEVTDLYVRFLPKDTAQLYELAQIKNAKLYGYPLDYEVVKEGDRYNDPSIPEGQISWIYSVVKPGFTVPANIRYEIIDSLHKPEDGEEFIEAQALLQTNNLPKSVSSELIGNEIKKTAQSAKMSNSKPEMGKLMGLFGRKHYPSGNIYVHNTVTNGYDPLRRMKVFVKYWFWEDEATTDNNGYFRINSRYSHEVGLYASFRSNEATIRKGFNEWTGLWVSEKIHNQKGENQGAYISKGGDDRLWRKASVHNAVTLYADYANQNGMQAPNDVNIWLSEGLADANEGVTLMLKGKNVGNYLFGNDNIGLTENEFWNFLPNAVATTVDFLAIPDNIKPDIVYGWDGMTNTQDIYALVFHELAHYSHFYKAGQFEYWRGVAKATANVGDNYNYGLGTQTNAGQLAVAEAWGHYIGYYLSDKILNSNHNLDKLENQSPRQIPDAGGIDWIPFGLFYDILDDTPGEVVYLRNGNGEFTGIDAPDDVNGITPAMLYQQLTLEVNNMPILRDKLTTSYPSYNIPAFTQLFNSYGY